jgi:uncharacterized protein YkwD
MKIFVMLGLCASLMGCLAVPIPVTVSMGQTSPREIPLPQTAPAIGSFDQQFAAVRAAQGLPALRSNASLDRSALSHSQDMVANNYLAHADRNGNRAQDRVRAARITNCGIGENIAKGQKSVEEVVAAWMASPGHRRNMLNRDYVSYGIGRVGDTWTLVFALPC